MLKTFLLLWVATSAALAQDFPKYFVQIHQARTLFAQNESVMVTLRLGNQVESIMKPRKFPDLLAGLHVYSGDTELKRDPKYTSKKLFKGLEPLGYGGHKDFRINLKRYYPEMKKGGIFRIEYKDKNYHHKGRKISILKLDLPDLDVQYVIKTSEGDIVVELDPIQARNHTRNFALLVATDFYRDMIWHRVEPNYVIQTGCPIGDGTSGSGFSTGLENSPFLRHKKYALAAARKDDPNSADSQFYICLDDIPDLNNRYSVFGNVVEGFETVDKIGKAPTTGYNGKPPNKPLADIQLYEITTRPIPKKK